jgi:hypothetical protein
VGTAGPVSLWLSSTIHSSIYGQSIFFTVMGPSDVEIYQRYIQDCPLWYSDSVHTVLVVRVRGIVGGGKVAVVLVDKIFTTRRQWWWGSAL